MDYYEIYKKRLNRYGLDYQSRIQGQRDRNFDDYLLKSIYRVDFWYNDTFAPATLETYKQDYTETQCYLLTKRDLDIPSGTILMVQSRDGSTKPWMIWWKEEIEASGYNRYVVLRMTHLLVWQDAEKVNHEQWAYFSGTGTTKISDTIKSSTGEAIYKENNNLQMFITSYNSSIVKDMHFNVTYDTNTSTYVVMETDIFSTPGVMYVTIDPTYRRPKENQDSDQTAADFWLNGGEN